MAAPRLCASSAHRWAVPCSKPVAALPFLVDAVSYACSTVSLLLVRTRFQEERERDPAPPAAAAAEGLAFTWRQPFLRTTAFLYGLLNFSALGLLFCIVIIGQGEGLSGGVIGLLTGVFAASVVVGSFLSRFVRSVLSVHAVLLLEVWAWLGCAVFLLWPRAVVLALGLVPVGLAVPSTDSVVNGYRIAATPDRLLGTGRVRPQRHRVVRRLACSPGCRLPVPALDTPLDGGLLHRLGPGAGHLGDGEPRPAGPAAAATGPCGPLTAGCGSACAQAGP